MSQRSDDIFFFNFFTYADEQALQFGKYSTMLKKKRKPYKVPLKVFFFLNIADQCFQQTEKKKKEHLSIFFFFFFFKHDFTVRQCITGVSQWTLQP